MVLVFGLDLPLVLGMQEIHTPEEIGRNSLGMTDLGLLKLMY